MSNASLRNTVTRRLFNAIGRPYRHAFYSGQQSGSRRSAEVIVPLIVDLVDPRSVVDVGCGVGTWLSVFREWGVEEVLGLDGDYVPRDQLVIPGSCFAPADISEALELHRRFDLAICLEVAEHLPPTSSDTLVASLIGLADVVLFSAAIPRQRGSGHVNERWQNWWAQRFAAHGFVPVDCIRRHVWSHPEVEWWYAQNTLVYTKVDQLEDRARLDAEHRLMGIRQLSIVHPARYVKWHKRLRRPFA